MSAKWLRRVSRSILDGMRKKLKIGAKQWSLEWVDDIPEECQHLREYGYRGIRGDYAGLVDKPFQRILVKRGMGEYEHAATIFHELLHVSAPRLSEYTVKKIEERLFPILWGNGFRFDEQK